VPAWRWTSSAKWATLPASVRSAPGERATIPAVETNRDDIIEMLPCAGADTLVDPAGSEQFAAAAPVGVVRSQRFETLYHEIFNETGHDEPVTLVKAWLRERDLLARSA
jgi:alpha-beta hydrolase superfamily lysophospholipase